MDKFSPPKRASGSAHPEVELLCCLTFSDQRGNIPPGVDYGAIEFSRKIHMPILPCPFVYFSREPDWLDLEVLSWEAWEQDNLDTLIRAESAPCHVTVGSKEDVEILIQEMLQNGWKET